MFEMELFISSQESNVDYMRRVAQSCRLRKDVKTSGRMNVL